METNDAGGIFGDQLKSLIDGFTKDRNRHKRRGLYLKLSTAALAAMATVLLGWQEEAPRLATLFKNLALVANALITVFAAYEAFFEPRRLWVRETAVLNTLRDIQRDFDLERADGALSPERSRAYQERVNGALKASLDTWVQQKSASTA